MKYKFILNELKTIGEPDGVFFAYRGIIFFPEQEEISQKTIDRISKLFQIEPDWTDEESLSELLNDEERYDIIHGEMSGSNLKIYPTSLNWKIDPEMSPLIKKLAKHFGAKKVYVSTSQGDIRAHYPPFEGDWPKVIEAYHGTTTAHLPAILIVTGKHILFLPRNVWQVF